MRKARNFRWPLGTGVTIFLYAAVATPLLYYGIRGFFWTIAAAGHYLCAHYGVCP